MPCYQVNLVSVEFKAKNVELLFRALDSLQWKYSTTSARVNGKESGVTGVYIPVLNGRLNLVNNTIEVPDYAQQSVNKLKVEYSKQVLMEACKKKKWILKRKKENNKFQIGRY